MSHSNMRVLFVSHTYVVGVNQGKLDAVASTGKTDVGLLVPNEWKAQSWKRLFKLETPFSSIQYYPAKVLLSGRGGGYFYLPSVISQAIREFQPDIIQVEQEVFSLSAFELALWARRTGKPLVIFGWENLDRQLSPIRQWMRRFVMDTADLIIAGNQDGKKLLRQWGYTGAIEVMPQMGVDPTLFSPELRQPDPDGIFTIGYMGRLVDNKGIDLLFSAAHQLRELGYRFRVVLCGSGRDEEKLRQEAQQRNVADLITWLGKVPHGDVPKEMGKFDVLVLPSRTVLGWKEQFGHVLIEAMAMGVPVVGSSCGEIPNVIGREDLIFPEGDAEVLSGILQRMLSESDWHKAVSQYGIDRVYQLYTHERIAEQLVKAWSDLLEERC